MTDTSKPAFPRSGPGGDEGMSLRDYFAAAALPGVIAEFGVSAEGRAKLCYEYADALLAERKKP